MCYLVRRDMRRILIQSGTWSQYLKTVCTSNLGWEENWDGNFSLQIQKNIIAWIGLSKETNSNLTSSDRLWLQYEKQFCLDMEKHENLVSYLGYTSFPKEELKPLSRKMMTSVSLMSCLIQEKWIRCYLIAFLSSVSPDLSF